MSKIDEMLKNEKVEWKKLGDVAEISTGKSNTNEKVDDGKYPFYVRSKDIKRSDKFEFDETAIIIPGEGGVGDIFHYVQGKYALHQRAYRIHLIKGELNPKFIYYFIVENFKRYIEKHAVSATVSSIRKPMIENFKVPILPLEIQDNIVNEMDEYTLYLNKIKNELQKEIDLREKQYKHYCEKLLTFDTERTRGGYQLLSKDYISLLTQAGDLVGVNVFELEKKKLEEVCEILDSKRKPITKSKRIKGIYPYYGANGIQDYVNDFIFDGSFVLMGEDGSVIDKNNNPILHWVNNKKIWVNNHAHVLKNKNDFINLKYIYYSLSISDVSSIVKGTPPKINQANLRNIKILIPPLPIQEYIVSILDEFEALSQLTTEGLRREIELREKQYEYYREKLLAFEK